MSMAVLLVLVLVQGFDMVSSCCAVAAPLAPDDEQFVPWPLPR